MILGADTRATEGTVVADKNCAKIHYISQNIRYVKLEYYTAFSYTL